MHGRDHEHGGADPLTVVYEDVGDSGGGGGGDGIKFDTHPQSGEWLAFETTGEGGPTGVNGIDIKALGGAPIYFTTGGWPDGGSVYLQSSGSHASLTLTGALPGSNIGVAQLSSNDETSIVSGAELLLIVGTFLRIMGLPTTNPGGTNRVWNDGGTLKIT
jgi:hypothetical protein